MSTVVGSVGDGGAYTSTSAPAAITGAAAGTLITGADNTLRTFSGNFGGAISVTKIGSGTWTLTGLIAITGSLTVNQGTIQLAQSPYWTGQLPFLGPSSLPVVLANAGSGTATLSLNGFNTAVKSISVQRRVRRPMAAGPTSQGIVNLGNATLAPNAVTIANADADVVYLSGAGGPQGAVINGPASSCWIAGGAHWERFNIDHSLCAPRRPAGPERHGQHPERLQHAGCLQVRSGHAGFCGDGHVLRHAEIAGGTLRIASASSIPSGSPLALVQSTTNAIFDANGQSPTVAALLSTQTGTGFNEILLGAGGLTFGGNGAAQTFTGLIAGGPSPGTAALTKLGSGVQTLSGVNQFGYTGDTLLNGTAGSTLKMGAASALPYGSRVVVNANNTLDIAALATTIGSLSGAGTVTDSGNAATLTTGYDNTNTTFSGTFTETTAVRLSLTKIGTGALPSPHIGQQYGHRRR